MLHVTLILADTLLIATVDSSNRWIGTCADTISGKSQAFSWSQAEFTAVVSLAVGVGEEVSVLDTVRLYEIAEPLLAGWDNAVRPIP